MFCNIKSACIYGLESIQVNVEVSATTGLPQETIIGLPDTVVKESRSRIKSAIQLSGFELPPMAYTINLSPTDILKRNTSLELAICVGLLQVSNQITIQKEYCFIGGLSLDGHITPIRQLLPLIHFYNNKDIPFVISKDNVDNIQCLDNINIITISHLSELQSLDTASAKKMSFKPNSISNACTQNFDQIIGQNLAKTAAAYSIVGNHPLIMIGAPGIGKTFLADHLPSLMPTLNSHQAIENTCIESLLNSTPTYSQIAPFRAPHHTVTYPGMIGGQNPPKPGEITRANHGILFLDELGEYQRSILETLREPMESKKIQISRAGNSIQFPANFLLVAAMNPCYCGYYFDQNSPCSCSSAQIKKYWQKLSKPLLDRFSMTLVLSKPKNEINMISHKELSQMVTTGLKTMAKRNKGIANNNLSNTALSDILSIDNAAQLLLDQFINKHNWSFRAKYRFIKLCLTIADCSGDIKIKKNHVNLGLQLSQHSQLGLSQNN